VKKLGEAKDWTAHRLEKLTGYPYYKLHAGDYRAIITWDREADRLIVEAVGHRRNIYDRHLPPCGFRPNPRSYRPSGLIQSRYSSICRTSVSSGERSGKCSW
jgi:mRNA interferase RelE/StbE